MLPVKPFKRLMKFYSGKRISDEAAEKMKDYIENLVSKLFKESAALATHAGRKTVLLSDVRLAKKKLNL